jgi:putative NIF3 family GTP cyclohydrolase 1 type 2
MPAWQVTPIQAVKKVWEKIAPLQLAERSWDNVGIMIGASSEMCGGIMSDLNRVACGQPSP